MSNYNHVFYAPIDRKDVPPNWVDYKTPDDWLNRIWKKLENNGLKNTVRIQQILSLTGIGFLAGSWLLFIKGLKLTGLLNHILGYMMIGAMVINPRLMINELFIAPEAITFFLMCGLIYCITFIFCTSSRARVWRWVLSLSVFTNLYLAAPMPKWIFASLLLDIFFIYLLLNKKDIVPKQKLLLLAVPHLLYFVLVPLQEAIHKIDLFDQDRLYIEYKQMVYTHFDILITDKTNFELPESLQDSMVVCFHEAKQNQPNFLIGFSNDYLMWGKANKLIDNHFRGNGDSLKLFYRNLNWKLASKYPLELCKSIVTQIVCFIIPNSFIHKELYSSLENSADTYLQTIEMANRFDKDLIKNITRLKLQSKAESFENIKNHYSLEPYYTNWQNRPIVIDPVAKSFPEITKHILITHWFDYLFFTTMFLFIAIKIFSKQLRKQNQLVLFYILILTYVFTIAIIHTLDISRFTYTIYPFGVITTFMATTIIGKTLTDFFSKQFA